MSNEIQGLISYDCVPRGQAAGCSFAEIMCQVAVMKKAMQRGSSTTGIKAPSYVTNLKLVRQSCTTIPYFCREVPQR